MDPGRPVLRLRDARRARRGGPHLRALRGGIFTENRDGVEVGARCANATVQELMEHAEHLPIVFHISRGGCRMELVESQPLATAPVEAPPAPTAPHPRKRKGKKPGPKPKKEKRVRAYARLPGKLANKIDRMAKAGKTVGEISEATGVAYKTVWTRVRNSAKASASSSAPAAIPRRMKRDPIEALPPAPVSASASIVKISKATAATRAVAERIAAGEVDEGTDPDIRALASCPHCNEALAVSRYGAIKCRNAGCDLYGEDLLSTRVFREDCNCASCLKARTAEAADLETSTGAIPAAQGA